MTRRGNNVDMQILRLTRFFSCAHYSFLSEVAQRSFCTCQLKTFCYLTSIINYSKVFLKLRGACSNSKPDAFANRGIWFTWLVFSSPRIFFLGLNIALSGQLFCKTVKTISSLDCENVLFSEARYR